MIRMLDDRVLVEPIKNPEINPDGVVYVGQPMTTFCQGKDKAEQICMGKVVSVGPGKINRKTGKRRPLDVETGEYVAFSDTCHKPADEYLVIREGDVMAKSDIPFTDCQVIY